MKLQFVFDTSRVHPIVCSSSCQRVLITAHRQLLKSCPGNHYGSCACGKHGNVKVVRPRTTHALHKQQLDHPLLLGPAASSFEQKEVRTTEKCAFQSKNAQSSKNCARRCFAGLGKGWQRCGVCIAWTCTCQAVQK